jgi:hypothetical protein
MYQSLLDEHLQCSQKWEQKFQENNSSLVTPAQMSILSGRKRKVQWSSEDLSRAFTVRVVGRQSYNLLRFVLKYPMPCLQTLDKYAQHLNIIPGMKSFLFAQFIYLLGDLFFRFILERHSNDENNVE